MSQILRMNSGTIAAPSKLLADLDHFLVAEDAPNVSDLDALMAKVEECRQAGRDPELDRDLVEEAAPLSGHAFLSLVGVHALLRLHAGQDLTTDHRGVPAGEVDVDVRYLCTVRNELDTLTLGCPSCSDHLDELLAEGLEDEAAPVREAVATMRSCYACEACHFGLLRDRIDELLDDAGYRGGSRYEAYRDPRVDDQGVELPSAEALWNTHVVGTAS